MHGLPMSQLRNLFAATEAVGHHNGHWSCGLHCRQQTIACDGFRDLEFVCLETKRAGHAAAPCLDRLDSCASLAQQSDFLARSAKYSFMVAVAVQQNMCSLKPPCSPPCPPVRCFGAQPVGQQPHLSAEAARACVVREKFE